MLTKDFDYLDIRMVESAIKRTPKYEYKKFIKEKVEKYSFKEYQNIKYAIYAYIHGPVTGSGPSVVWP